ncbi:MAG: hypothetical protein LBK60_10915 [Verrucomicrobiales bacterium]|nr:hypothetical protein [Verrucomicrobiales bacterium]
MRQGYDDNIYTSSNNERGSMYTTISPEFWLKYPWGDSTLEARYIFTARHYWNPGPYRSDWDYSHNFNLRFNHNFNDRLSLELRDQFVFSQSPQLGSGNSIVRYLGDGYINNASAALTYAWTRQFSTVTTYNNTFNNYSDNEEHYINGQWAGHSINYINNYFRNGVSQDFRYAFLDTTTGVLNFTYDNYNYGYEHYKTYDSYILTAGADHYLMPTWLLSGRVGAQMVEYEVADISSSINPYVNLRSVWYYLPKSSFEASYTYSTGITDNGNYATSEGHTFNLDITHYWTPKFYTTAGVLLIFNTFDASQSLSQYWSLQSQGSIHETTLQPYARAGYEFTNWFSLEVGYMHTTVTSGDPGRPYWDNQFYVGVRASY